MKKIIWGILLGIGLFVYALGGSITEKVTWTDTFLFLRGDAEAVDTTDTFFYELAYDMSPYRVVKLFYQANMTTRIVDTLDSLMHCSMFVDIQTGTGSKEGYWGTLKTLIITGDSLYSTSGWDLDYTLGADSVDKFLRFVSRIKTQASDSGDSAAEKIANAYTAEHLLEILGRE